MFRVVKLEFQEGKIDEFLPFFEEVKWNIATFPGCKGMRLWRDMHQPNVVFTYSEWVSENDLNAYRDSELFQGVWSKVKPLFATKAQAWSVEVAFDGFAPKE